MIKSFADDSTEQLFCQGDSKAFPKALAKRAIRKLDMVDSAHAVEDLRVPPGNRLHKLQGSRANQYSISVNDQWRICFEFEDGNAYEVEMCDYR